MAPLLSSSLLLIAEAPVEGSDNVLEVVVMATMLLGLVLLVALRVGVSRHSKPPPQSQRGARRSTPPPSSGVVRSNPEVESVPSSRRRVIRLFETTPGQSPHEYNIGDTQGSRGSAIVRAA